MIKLSSLSITPVVLHREVIKDPPPVEFTTTRMLEQQMVVVRLGFGVTLYERTGVIVESRYVIGAQLDARA